MAQQFRVEADLGGARSPRVGPGFWVRPTTVAGAVGAGFALGVVPAGFITMAVTPERVATAILLWGIVAVVVAAPVGLVIGLVGLRAERALVARTPPNPYRWLLWGPGVATAAHWAPLCAWGPALVLRATMRPSRADELLVEAVLSLVAWVAVGVGIGAIVAARRLGAAPAGRVASPPRYLPSRVPVSLALAGAAALSSALPAGLWLVWLESAWGRGGGIAGLVAWAFVAAGGAVLAGGLTGVVCVGAMAVEPSLVVGVRARQIEVIGAVGAGAWAAVFLNVVSNTALSGSRLSEDLRFTVLFVAMAAVTVATALWSSGWRVRAAEEAASARVAPRR